MNDENENGKRDDERDERTGEGTLNPTLKVQPLEPRKITDAPFDCPHCRKPANTVQMSPVGQGGAVLVFWCGMCRAVLSVQLSGGVNPMQRVVQPAMGGMMPRGLG